MPELIDRFNAVASPYLDLFPAATCIEQSRILIEVLCELGICAEPIETAMKVHCPELNLAYVAGADAEERERGKAVAGEWIDRTTPAHEGYGHLVVAALVNGENFLLDPTMAQASMPEPGMAIPRGVLPIGPLSQWPAPGSQIDAGLDLADGKRIAVTWLIRDTRKFESTPAWEPSHLWPIIHVIVREMKWAAIVAEAGLAARRAGGAQ